MSKEAIMSSNTKVPSPPAGALAQHLASGGKLSPDMQKMVDAYLLRSGWAPLLPQRK